MASTFFAALAAGASWASVVQTRHAERARSLPRLHVQSVLVGTQMQDHKRAGLAVYDEGPGLAKSVAYALASDGRWAGGFFGTGFLRPGETADVGLDECAGAEGSAVVECRDGDERVRAWTADGSEQAWERPAHHLAIGEIWRALFAEEMSAGRRQVSSRAQVWLNWP